jgi:uncharacterized tellurite resistance protein B-like protein
MPRLTIRVEACTEILAILISMAWADGQLADPEKESIREAAGVLNLSKEHRQRIDTLLASPIPLGQVLVGNLGPKDRSFAYVAAAWMSNVDQDVDDKEKARLDEIRSLLELDETRAHELADLARDLGRKKGSGSWASELVSLFKAIPVRLERSDEEEVEVAFE